MLDAAQYLADHIHDPGVDRPLYAGRKPQVLRSIRQSRTYSWRQGRSASGLR
jgi:hypothetical protein